jgi:hypothetical protein
MKNKLKVQGFSLCPSFNYTKIAENTSQNDAAETISINSLLLGFIFVIPYGNQTYSPQESDRKE